VDCAFTTEAPVFSQPDGSVCAARSVMESEEGLRLNCDTGFGSATFVTGTFGFVAAGLTVKKITAM
jgi:tRNA A37 threonylcarbamoyladenosine dehydratase